MLQYLTFSRLIVQYCFFQSDSELKRSTAIMYILTVQNGILSRIFRMYGVQMYFEFAVATALEGTNIAAVHNLSRT
ncbi:unnamed protein product [Brugia timori]|uniref:Proton_antipo_M domain-containing protein n=1 Tax=Brugia timori TaxID=42155 RepID=A0A0R3R8N2_9BILA|nr:unnamed protein product [Brugia timori]